MENSKVEKAKPRLMLRSKSVLIPLVTFIILLICYGAYVFWYVSGEETYYNDRAFRVLSVLNQRFGENIDGIRDVLGASTALPTLKEKPNEKNEESSGKEYFLQRYVADHLEPYGVTPEKVAADWKGICEEAHRDEKLRLIEDGSTGPFSLKVDLTC